jgi:hypothetical protein
MSEGRSPPSAKLAVPLVVLAVLGPLIIRFWGEIVPMLPIWARMLGQAGILLVVLVALAAVAAVLAVIWRRLRAYNA